MQNKLDIFITLDLTLESCSHGPSNPAKYENIQDVTSKFKKGILKSKTSLKAGWPWNEILKWLIFHLSSYQIF